MDRKGDLGKEKGRLIDRSIDLETELLMRLKVEGMDE